MKQKSVNNRIILGSIVSAIIIISAAFTSVGSFQTIKSNYEKNSPLFSIRINRATDQLHSEIVTSDYIGKRGAIDIPFPTKNYSLILFQKTIDGISGMDDLTFNKFVNAAIVKLVESNMVKEEDISTIEELFKFVRENPDEAKKYPFDMKKHSYTIGCPPPTFDETPEWCFTIFVFVCILIVTFPIWFPIYAFYVIKEGFFMNLSYRNLCFTIRPKCE